MRYGLLILLILVGCSGSGDSAANAEPKVAFVTNGVADFWILAGKGVEDASRDLKIAATFHMPPDGLTDQKRIIEDLLVKGVHGIAVSPIDPGNQTPFLNEVASQTKLITHDSDAPESDRVCFVGVDNYEAGWMCGEVVKDAIPDGGRIAIFVGRMEQENARLRRQGLIDFLLGREADPARFDKPGSKVSGNGYEIVATLTDQFDMAKGKANVEDVLSAHGNLDCLIGLFAYNTPLILEALEQSGKLGKIKVVGFDEDERTLEGIRAGTVHATVVQDPYEYGVLSVAMLKSLIAGDTTVIPPGGHVKVPAKVIGKAEVDAFQKDMLKKLGK